MANRINCNGGPRKAPQPSPRLTPAPAMSGPATADRVSGNKNQNQNQPELRRLKKKQKEKARRQRRGEGRRNTSAHNQVVAVGRPQNEPSADNKTQAADPAATRRRTEGVGGSSNQAVAVAVVSAVAAVAGDIQVVGRPQKEPSADNKTHEAADLAVPRRTEDVGSTSRVAAAAVEKKVVVAAPLASVAVVAGPPSAATLATTKSETAHDDQQALARLRLGSLLLPLIKNKLRRSKAAGRNNKATTEYLATNALEEAGEHASPKQSTAEIAKVLKAEAVRLEGVAVAAKAHAKECAERLTERLCLEERLLEEVTKQLDTRALELSLKTKTCGSAPLDAADKAFLEMYTGKTPAEFGCARDGSYDSGSTHKANSYESMCDNKECSEGSGLEGQQQCLPSSPTAARSPPMPSVRQMHPGVCLVDFGGTFYPMPSLPVQQQQPQQAGQTWVPPGGYSSDGAECQTPMQYAHPQAITVAYYEEESALGTGICYPSSAQQYALPPPALTRGGQNFAGTCPAPPVLPALRYAPPPPPPMAYGGDATYPPQTPREQPLHTAYRGNTEGGVYPPEVPQKQQPFRTTSEGHLGWGMYNQPPIMGYEGGRW